MKLVFLPEAQTELEQASAYYDACGFGLGDEFVGEIEATIQRIQVQPMAWAGHAHSTRRCLTQRFPYVVVYQVRQDSVLIVAVAHLHREPGYWSHRLPTKYI